VGVPVLPVVYAVVFAQACVVHVVGPASGALVPLVVAAPQLVAANALTTLTGGVARLAGPSLGGALLGFAGFEAVVVVDAASFLVSAALVALVAVRPTTAAPMASVEPPALRGLTGHAHPTGPPGTDVGPHPMHLWADLWADLGQGLRLIAGLRRLRVVLCAGGLVMVGYGAVTVLLAAFVRDVLGGGALGFGGLATAQGVGTLLGSALVAQAGSAVRPGRLFALSLGVTGLALLATFNAPALALALPGMALAGGGIAGSTAGERTLLQTAVPNRYVGRILGAFGTSNGSFILVGMGAASALAGPLGVVAALNLAAALYVAAAALALLWLPAPEPRGQPAQ
jgi:hypothetical protein